MLCFQEPTQHSDWPVLTGVIDRQQIFVFLKISISRSCSSVDCLSYVHTIPHTIPLTFWCTKFFSLLLRIYFYLWVPVLAPTYLFPRRSQKVFTLQDWHKTYPVCDIPLLRSARHSFASSQKSLCHNRSCLWTEALSGKILVAAQRPSLV